MERTIRVRGSLDGPRLLHQGVFEEAAVSSFESAEAELCAMTENSKDLVSLGMLLESILL